MISVRLSLLRAKLVKKLVKAIGNFSGAEILRNDLSQ